MHKSRRRLGPSTIEIKTCEMRADARKWGGDVVAS